MARADANRTLGRGKLMVDIYEDNAPSGEFYVGNTTSLTISTDEETLDHFDSDEGIREKDDSITLQQDESIAFTTDDIQPENLAMFFKAEGVGSNVVVAAPGVTEDIVVVRKGRWLQLGQSAATPTGARSVTLNSVTDSTPTALDPASYDFDAELGRIFIFESAADVADGDTISLDYDIAESTRTTIISKGQTAEGAMRFISTNPKGVKFDHYWPKVTVRAEGDYELKGDDWQQMSFAVEVLKRAGYERHYIDGRPA